MQNRGSAQPPSCPVIHPSLPSPPSIHLKNWKRTLGSKVSMVNAPDPALVGLTTSHVWGDITCSGPACPEDTWEAEGKAPRLRHWCGSGCGMPRTDRRPLLGAGGAGRARWQRSDHSGLGALLEASGQGCAETWVFWKARPGCFGEHLWRLDGEGRRGFSGFSTHSPRTEQMTHLASGRRGSEGTGYLGPTDGSLLSGGHWRVRQWSPLATSILSGKLA